MKQISFPVQLLLLVFGIAFFGHLVPTTITKILYTFSVNFKEVISFLLPFIVFAFISVGITSFKKNAPIVLGLLIACIVVSNATVATISYFLGIKFLPYILPTTMPNFSQAAAVMPYFAPKIPIGIKTEYSMIAAVITGIILSFGNFPSGKQFVEATKKLAESFLHKIFLPLLPLYVAGFLLALNEQDGFLHLFTSYGKTFSLIVLMQAGILFMAYVLAAAGSIKQAFQYISTALPTYITAFSSMSSTATIPVSVQAAEKNTGNRSLAEVSMPILANVHLLGDAITTPILALVTLYLFTGTVPAVSTYIVFIMYFCVTMLAASGIPGGGIIVMIPILQDILGFNGAMISIITTLYMLQDGLGTAGNVMGDGALVIMLHKLLKRMNILS